MLVMARLAFRVSKYKERY